MRKIAIHHVSIIAMIGLGLGGCASLTPRVAHPSQQQTHVHVTNRNNIGPFYPGGQDGPASHAGWRGEDSQEAARGLLDEIVLAYRKDAHARVLDLTRAVLALRSATRFQRARALTYAGAICFVHGDPAGARRYFQQALRENPEVFPDDKIRTSAMVDCFLSVRQDVTGR